MKVQMNQIGQTFRFAKRVDLLSPCESKVGVGGEGVPAKGFSIIEAIASCIILGIAVVALINFFPTSSIMNARANRMNEASVLAEDLIEWFRCAPFDTLKDFIEAGNDTGTHVIGGPLAGERFTRTWNLTDNGNIIQAEVNCSWRNPGNPGSSTVRLVTQISNHD